MMSQIQANLVSPEHWACAPEVPGHVHSNQRAVYASFRAIEALVLTAMQAYCVVMTLTHCVIVTACAHMIERHALCMHNQIFIACLLHLCRAVTSSYVCINRYVAPAKGASLLECLRLPYLISTCLQMKPMFCFNLSCAFR